MHCRINWIRDVFNQQNQSESNPPGKRWTRVQGNSSSPGDPRSSPCQRCSCLWQPELRRAAGGTHSRNNPSHNPPTTACGCLRAANRWETRNSSNCCQRRPLPFPRTSPSWWTPAACSRPTAAPVDRFPWDCAAFRPGQSRATFGNLATPRHNRSSRAIGLFVWNLFFPPPKTRTTRAIRRQW